jgi:hypothetical protein
MRMVPAGLIARTQAPGAVRLRRLSQKSFVCSAATFLSLGLNRNSEAPPMPLEARNIRNFAPPRLQRSPCTSTFVNPLGFFARIGRICRGSRVGCLLNCGKCRRHAHVVAEVGDLGWHTMLPTHGPDS